MPADKHAAQAYGAGNFMALGLVLQQALIISTLVFLAIMALWSQAGPILLAAGEQALEVTLALVKCACVTAETSSCFSLVQCYHTLHISMCGLAQGPTTPSVNSFNRTNR